MSENRATSSPCIDRAALLARDSVDPLAALREAFDLPADVLYLDGNSLGALPKRALEIAQRVLQDEWRSGLIRSWNDAGWFSLPRRLGDKIAQLIGAEAGEVVVTDSTSVNLFKVLNAALQLRAGRKGIVSERENFPTDLYMAEGLAHMRGQGHVLRLVDAPEELEVAIAADCAVLMLTHVNYRNGRMHDMARITRLAHDRGALVVWDLAHSAGAVPVDLNACEADFAVGVVGRKVAERHAKFALKVTVTIGCLARDRVGRVADFDLFAAFVVDKQPLSTPLEHGCHFTGTRQFQQGNEL